MPTWTIRWASADRRGGAIVCVRFRGWSSRSHSPCWPWYRRRGRPTRRSTWSSPRQKPTDLLAAGEEFGRALGRLVGASVRVTVASDYAAVVEALRNWAADLAS